MSEGTPMASPKNARRTLSRQSAIAPSDYYTCRALQFDPAQQPPGALRVVMPRDKEPLVWKHNSGVRGVRKLSQQLLHDEYTLARCTVAPLMAAEHQYGAVHGQHPLTTVVDAAGEFAQGPVQRQFQDRHPNRQRFADFTYVITSRRFVYVARQ